jgi:hypothetical protein
MNTDFRWNSPTIVLAFGSLLFLTIGGPMLWVGARAATSGQAWAYPTMYAGFGVFGLGYILFVSTLIAAFATIIFRALRSSRIDATSPPDC